MTEELVAEADLGGEVARKLLVSSEEMTPNEMVRNARRAEETGFTTAWISDHYLPWIDAQGESPFVWSVIGGIATATEGIRLGTGVTCPTMRIHPAIIVQATATSAAMLEGRFWFGVGSGENLNEHILGVRWPPTDVRSEMLEEAIHVIRLLWEGGNKQHYGKHYTVENARLYSLPDESPPIYVSAPRRSRSQPGSGTATWAPHLRGISSRPLSGRPARISHASGR
jgi:coenzyme F420-dependent glucose-6-phosphate dehydrogenase